MKEIWGLDNLREEIIGEIRKEIKEVEKDASSIGIHDQSSRIIKRLLYRLDLIQKLKERS